MRDEIDCPHCGGMIEIEYSIKRLTKAHVMLLHPCDFAPWSQRVEQVFRENDIDTMHKLVMSSEKYLLGLPNFGKRSLAEVKEVLAANGMVLEG